MNRGLFKINIATLQGIRLCTLKIARLHKSDSLRCCGLGGKDDFVMTLFEKMGIEYEERDGLLYPLLSVCEDSEEQISVGKYGRMWSVYMKENYPDRYRCLLRFGKLTEMVVEIEEEAYALLDDIETKWMNRHMAVAGNSFMEMHRIRMQARMMAEEIVLDRVVRQYH